MRRALPNPPTIRSPEASHVWVITPCSRPEFLDNALANFARQRFPQKTLVLVENGPSVGQLAARAPGAIVVTSEQHIASAKNAALHEVRKRGGGFTAIFDDDDWYSEHYLDEAVGFARQADVVGKTRHFLDVEGVFWCCWVDRANRRSQHAVGGTICGWAETLPDYPRVTPADDLALCTKLLEMGAKIWSSSIYHYLYRRHGGEHTWSISRENWNRLPFMIGAIELGEVDLRVVSGERNVSRYRIRGRNEWQELI